MAMAWWSEGEWERERKRGRLGLIGGQCLFGNRPRAVKERAGARRSRPKRRQGGRRRRGEKGRKGRGKGDLPLATLGKEGRRERATRQWEEELCLQSLGACAVVAGPGRDDGDDGGGGLEGRGYRAVGSDGGGDWPVSHHGARAREATARGIQNSGAGLAGEREKGSGRVRERESGEREMALGLASAHAHARATHVRGEGEEG
uniref:Uncharacterized protein n=1 Tax=Oryza sativa subsp. japonica TaxID=39947 RepID=Q7XI58_ORYSJ|nr:hypothetical protein [Oryza sativa Japonica Group]